MLVALASLASCGRVGFEEASSQPPWVSLVVATSREAPDDPPALDPDLLVAPGQPVFIRWIAADDRGLGPSSVSIYQTLDDREFTRIEAALDNADNNACARERVPGATGCFRWDTPPAGFFRVQVRATDDEGQVGTASSQPLNTPDLRFLAGPGDLARGGTASDAAFIAARAGLFYSDQQAFAVTSRGAIYFRDRDRGLLYVDPQSGIQELLIPTTAASSGDRGPARQATLAMPSKITLDAEERVLIFDGDRIRRIDPTTRTW
jgi:hypothetical protein